MWENSNHRIITQLTANCTENFDLFKTLFPYSVPKKVARYKIWQLKYVPAWRKRPVKNWPSWNRNWEQCGHYGQAWSGTAAGKQVPNRPEQTCVQSLRVHRSHGNHRKLPRKKHAQRNSIGSPGWPKDQASGRPQCHFYFMAVWAVCRQVQCLLRQSYFKHF